MGKVADCYQALKTAVDNAADDVVKSISQNLRKAVIEAKASK
jgi:hypothetical protein